MTQISLPTARCGNSIENKRDPEDGKSDTSESTAESNKFASGTGTQSSVTATSRRPEDGSYQALISAAEEAEDQTLADGVN